MAGKGATIRYPGAGEGLEFAAWTNYLFHLLSVSLYFFHRIPWLKYLFQAGHEEKYLFFGTNLQEMYTVI